jgi:hypothetical protein
LFCLSSSRSCPAEKPGPSEEIIITFILVCAETSPRAFVRFFINCKDNGLCFSPLVNSILTMFSVSFLIEKNYPFFDHKLFKFLFETYFEFWSINNLILLFVLLKIKSTLNLIKKNCY